MRCYLLVCLFFILWVRYPGNLTWFLFDPYLQWKNKHECLEAKSLIRTDKYSEILCVREGTLPQRF